MKAEDAKDGIAFLRRSRMMRKVARSVNRVNVLFTQIEPQESEV
jgi:hypothetical protein